MHFACALQVFLCALISRLVCTHTRAQLRGNSAYNDSPPFFFPLFIFSTFPTTPTFQSCNCFHSLIPSSFPFFFLPPRNPLLFPSSHVPHSGFFSFLSTFSKSFSCPSRSS